MVFYFLLIYVQNSGNSIIEITVRQWKHEKIILQTPYSSHQKAWSMGFYIICLAYCHGLFSFFSIKSGGRCTILSSAFPGQEQIISYLVYLEAVSQFHSCFSGSVYDYEL